MQLHEKIREMIPVAHVAETLTGLKSTLLFSADDEKSAEIKLCVKHNYDFLTLASFPETPRYGVEYLVRDLNAAIQQVLDAHIRAAEFAADDVYNKTSGVKSDETTCQCGGVCKETVSSPVLCPESSTIEI